MSGEDFQTKFYKAQYHSFETRSGKTYLNLIQSSPNTVYKLYA